MHAGALHPMALRDRLILLRDQIQALAAAHGAFDVRIFGSVARREERPNSDVDFLVALERGRTLLDVARLEERLEQLIGRPVDVLTEGELPETVMQRLSREAVDV